MKYILKFIKRRDLYGREITLNINGRETINSLCGGTISIFYFIFFLVILITNIQLFLKKDPIVTLSSAFRDGAEAYDDITQSELSFSFFLMDFKSLPPKPLSVYPYNISSLADKLVYVNNTETHNRTLKLGNMAKCEESPIYMDDELFKSPYNIAKTKASGKNFSLCFEVNKENSFFTVGGDTETRNTTFINNFRIYYDLCQLLDKPIGCNLSDSEYNQLSSLSLIFLLKNSYADYKKTSGINKFYEGKRYRIDLSMDYSVSLFHRRLKISTDRNIIYNLFESEQNQDYVHSITGSEKIKSSKKNEFIVNMDFQLLNYIDTVERRYLKIDDVLANIASIVGIVEILMIYLAGFFTEGNMEHSIYKEIYHIQKKQNHKASVFLNVDFTKFVIKKNNKLKENKKQLMFKNQHKNNEKAFTNEAQENYSENPVFKINSN